MHNKALWFRYFSERSGPKHAAMSYLSALLHDPSVASLAPSSRYVAERVVEAVRPARVGLAVELGPGDGVITRRLLRALPLDARLVAVELSADFIPALRGIRDARLSVRQGDARDLAGLGLPPADAVVSGVPMSLLEPSELRRMVEDVRGALRPGGRFVAYQVTPRLSGLLEKRFRRVEVRFELRNLPPLFVLSCVR